jgi:hypothetical protein
MLLPSRTHLERETIIRGRNYDYHPPRYSGKGRKFPLGLKSVFNGQALYETSEGKFAVCDEGYLILNAHQPYQMAIDSEIKVETFCINFPDQWVEEIFRSLAMPTDRLLDDPEGGGESPITFLERLYPHDDIVTPQLLALRQALAEGPPENGWLEETLRGLLVRLLYASRAYTTGQRPCPLQVLCPFPSITTGQRPCPCRSFDNPLNCEYSTNQISQKQKTYSSNKIS